jgi:hypothetical protein
MPAGRPPGTRCTPELEEIICSRLADGESLNSICNSPDFPVTESTVRRWAIDDAEFLTKYSRARELGIDTRMDRMRDRQVALMDLIDDDAPPQLVAAYAQAWRAETWHAAKCMPHKYGDRPAVAVNIDMRAEVEKRLEEIAFGGDQAKIEAWRRGEAPAIEPAIYKDAAEEPEK